MRFILAGVVVSLALGTAAWGDMIVELDVDGELGNGPDLVAAAQGDTIGTDVWLVGDDWGPELSWYFGVHVMDNGALDFLGGEVLLPLPWQGDPITESGDTVFVSAHDFTLESYPGPALKAARLLYRAADEGAWAR